jgi:hypothetical protein
MRYFKYLQSITAISLLILLATGCADATTGAERSSETDRDRQIEKPNFAQGKADGVTFDKTPLNFGEVRGNYLNDRTYAGYTFRADRGDEVKLTVNKGNSFTIAWVYGPFENGAPDYGNPIAWQFSENGKVVLNDKSLNAPGHEARFQPDSEAAPLEIPEKGKYLVVVGPRKETAQRQHHTISLDCKSGYCAVPFRTEKRCSDRTFDVMRNMSPASIGFEQAVEAGRVVEGELSLQGGRLSDSRQELLEEALRRYAADARNALRRYYNQTLEGSVRRHRDGGIAVTVRVDDNRDNSVAYLYDSEGNLRLEREGTTAKLCGGILNPEGSFATSCSASNVGEQILSQYASASSDGETFWDLNGPDPEASKFYELSPKVRRVISEYTNDEDHIGPLASFHRGRLQINIYDDRDGTVMQVNDPNDTAVSAQTYVFGPADKPLLDIDASKENACSQ